LLIRRPRNADFSSKCDESETATGRYYVTEKIVQI
jgi:hypothetical protein